MVNFEMNSISSRAKTMLTKLEPWFSKYSWLIPVVGFCLGWASFVLVQRGEGLARLIALLALLGWVWILLEPIIMNRLLGDQPSRLKSDAGNFLTQSIQQEILFFSLPFLFAATQLESLGQIAFTLFILMAATISTIDPWYARVITRYRLTSLAFHALCCFVAALVILPIVLKLPTEKTLLVAMGFLVLWLLLAIPRLFTLVANSKQRVWFFIGLCTLPLIIWLSRSIIPAAGLEATNSVVTSGVVEHEPIDKIKIVDHTALANGIYAYVAIKAPNGLTQEIRFKWYKGDYSETIVADITGGREQGYRTYTVKSNFPESSIGDWKVDVVTDQGQLLQRLEFSVTDNT